MDVRTHERNGRLLRDIQLDRDPTQSPPEEPVQDDVDIGDHPTQRVEPGTGREMADRFRVLGGGLPSFGGSAPPARGAPHAIRLSDRSIRG